ARRDHDDGLRRHLRLALDPDLDPADAAEVGDLRHGRHRRGRRRHGQPRGRSRRRRLRGRCALRLPCRSIPSRASHRPSAGVTLAIGVVVGVFVASVLFVRRVAPFVPVERTVTEASAHYAVRGELFFASSNDLTTQFHYTHDPNRVIIDMSDSHVWDASSVAALDAIMTKYENLGTTVELHGMNAYTEAIHARLSGGLG